MIARWCARLDDARDERLTTVALRGAVLVAGLAGLYLIAAVLL